MHYVERFVHYWGCHVGAPVVIDHCVISALDMTILGIISLRNCTLFITLT